MLHPTKGGYVWVIDCGTGEFLKAWPFVKIITWVAGIAENGTLVALNPRKSASRRWYVRAWWALRTGIRARISPTAR